MKESKTRVELIDPKLKACGWGVVEGSKILREHSITAGKIQMDGVRAKKLIADYVLVYKGVKLAVVEAKSNKLDGSEGVAQAKLYAEKLKLDATYSTNGQEIYCICMKTGVEGWVDNFLTPDELWNKTFTQQNQWREKFHAAPFGDKSGTWKPRYYQEIAIKNVLEAIANNQSRILLTLATGAGKTDIAFQISWKLFQNRWNLQQDGKRRPRILFLADRNILANQAYNKFSSFSAFAEDAFVRIKPNEIKKTGKVPTNGNIFFTIFQTFMSGTDQKGNSAPYFYDYPPDYFDLIIIDECHRGGANDESNWRNILEYFAAAVQLGLTATPKRDDNVDTYKYFGEPVYIYSLKEGINDGFLTPFRVKPITTTLDNYIYDSDDEVIEGEIETNKLYTEPDFNQIIEIQEREAKRVQIFMDDMNQNEKSIIFCATQNHALAVRNLINQYKTSTVPNYCVRVTADEGEIGEQFLRDFQDNDKSIPTILTTSRKLSTGVDASNIRNIVLMRPIKSMIEFKQIIGRGTRCFDGKNFFTIYDFVWAYQLFEDKAWDGDVLPCEICGKIICECPDPRKCCEICATSPCICEKPPSEPCEPCGANPCTCNKQQKIKVKLADGKEREIQFSTTTLFWSADGKPLSAEQFLHNLFGELPKFFKSEDELRKLWSNPITRRVLLEKLADAGFGKETLVTLQRLIHAEKSDLFDVLKYIFDGDVKPITRSARVTATKNNIFTILNTQQAEFIDFVLDKYIEAGVEELDQDKLPILLENKYHSLEDAKDILGNIESISDLFVVFQEYLYEQKAA